MEKVCPYHKNQTLKVLCTEKTCDSYRLLCARCTTAKNIKKLHEDHNLTLIEDLVKKYAIYKSDKAALSFLNGPNSEANVEILRKKMYSVDISTYYTMKDYTKILDFYELLQKTSNQPQPEGGELLEKSTISKDSICKTNEKLLDLPSAQKMNLKAPRKDSITSNEPVAENIPDVEQEDNSYLDETNDTQQASLTKSSKSSGRKPKYAQRGRPPKAKPSLTEKENTDSTSTPFTTDKKNRKEPLSEPSSLLSSGVKTRRQLSGLTSNKESTVKDSLTKESIKKASTLKESVNKESIKKGSILKESAKKENTKEESVLKSPKTSEKKITNITNTIHNLEGNLSLEENGSFLTNKKTRFALTEKKSPIKPSPNSKAPMRPLDMLRSALIRVSSTYSIDFDEPNDENLNERDERVQAFLSSSKKKSAIFASDVYGEDQLEQEALSLMKGENIEDLQNELKKITGFREFEKYSLKTVSDKLKPKELKEMWKNLSKKDRDQWNSIAMRKRIELRDQLEAQDKELNRAVPEKALKKAKTSAF